MASNLSRRNGSLTYLVVFPRGGGWYEGSSRAVADNSSWSFCGCGFLSEKKRKCVSRADFKVPIQPRFFKVTWKSKNILKNR